MATRQRILAAALKEFSDKGISGARVDAIAAEAGINKRMLYYYFGSKHALFTAVLRERLVDRPPSGDAGSRPDRTRLARRHDRLAGAVDYVRLLMWEALEHGTQSALDQEPLRRAQWDEWHSRHEAARRDGTLPPDIDIAQLVLSEFALVAFPYAFPQVTRLVTGRLPDDPRFQADRRRFLEQFAELLDTAARPTT